MTDEKQPEPVLWDIEVQTMLLQCLRMQRNVLIELLSGTDRTIRALERLTSR